MFIEPRHVNRGADAAFLALRNEEGVNLVRSVQIDHTSICSGANSVDNEGLTQVSLRSQPCNITHEGRHLFRRPHVKNPDFAHTLGDGRRKHALNSPALCTPGRRASSCQRNLLTFSVP